MKKIIFISFFIFLISCIDKLENKNPETNMPKSWVQEDEKAISKTKTILNWWDNFNDPSLDILVNEALKNNADVNIALANIEKAEANFNMNRSNLFPSIDAVASSQRQANSKDIISTINTKPLNTFNAGAQLNYQIDLWSKISSASKANRALLLASKSTKDNINLTVTSDLAKAYFNMLSLNKQKNLLTESIDTQKEIYYLNKLQFEAGSIDYETLISVEATLNNLQNSLSDIDQNIIEQNNAMKVLIGTKPEDFLKNIKSDSDIDHIIITPIIPKVLPSDLLTQRPDIMAAEENLKAANLQVVVARKYYLPDISLTGLIGLASSKLDDLFKSASTWQLGGSLTAPLFDFGKNKANLKIQQAEAKKSLTNYQQTIKIAFSEVLNALSAQTNSAIGFDKSKNNENIASKIDEMTRLKYSTGYSSYLAVLINRQNLLNAKIQTVKAKQQQINAMIDIFKSLGGNW